MRRTLLLTLALLLSACAHPRHVAVLADTALYETISDLHTTEQTLLCGQPSCAGVLERVTPTWTDDKSKEFNRRLLPAVAGGREFNAVLASWQPGQPMPTLLHQLVGSLGTALTTVAASFPEGTTKTQILADIAKAQAIVLSALDLLMSSGGN